MSKELKLVPNLRFPSFQKEDHWNQDSVQNLVITKTSPKKLQSSQYLEEGAFPIIDQSQNFYCGYTNDDLAIIKEDLPLIVFGDHTCALKMAREPFAQGADGIKILKPKPSIDAEYLYQYLFYNGVKQENYKRHFSKLKEKLVPFPELDSGEQQKIASCLSFLDELITAHKEKLAALKDHKKGLMQNLFPHKGQKVPGLRFPEFENGGEWVEKKLGKIADNWDSKRVPITSNKRENGEIPYYGASGIIDFVNNYIFDESLLLISEDGANLITRVYPIAFSISGKAWVNNHAHVLKFEKWHTQILVEVYLNSIKLYDYLTGMAQPKLNRKKLDIIPIPLPLSDQEQQKIASCLSSLDALITAQAEKILQLQAHKKGLMQRLFPQIQS